MQGYRLHMKYLLLVGGLVMMVLGIGWLGIVGEHGGGSMDI